MDEFVWEGNETSLYNLLIWWYQKTSKYTHYSTEALLDEGFNCFATPDDERYGWYAIEATRHVPFRSDSTEIPLTFIDARAGTKTDLKPGDKIIYKGDFVYAVEAV